MDEKNKKNKWKSKKILGCILTVIITVSYTHLTLPTIA